MGRSVRWQSTQSGFGVGFGARSLCRSVGRWAWDTMSCPASVSEQRPELQVDRSWSGRMEVREGTRVSVERLPVCLTGLSGMVPPLPPLITQGLR